MKRIVLFCLLAIIALAFCSCGKTGRVDLTSAQEDVSADNGASITTELAQSVSEIIEKTTELLESASESEQATEEKTTTTTTRPATTTRPSTTESTTVTTTASTTVTTTRAGERFDFTTTDINGNTVSLSDYSGAKVIMINMWEPWCGPCVNEMPDLNNLYKKYKDDGFVILGVTSSDTLSDAKSVVKRNRISYPILISSSSFYKFDTGYVPTTVFIDGEGYILTSEPLVGSKSSSEWERIIKGYLYS